MYRESLPIMQLDSCLRDHNNQKKDAKFGVTTCTLKPVNLPLILFKRPIHLAPYVKYPLTQHSFLLPVQGDPLTLSDNKRKTSFMKSVPMSTYLVCFAVHQFDFVERTSARGIPVSNTLLLV